VPPGPADLAGRRDRADGAVVVRIPFADFAGRTVCHYHMLGHEDLGMMGAVEVS